MASLEERIENIEKVLPSSNEIDAINERFEINTLRQLAEKYNAESPIALEYEMPIPIISEVNQSLNNVKLQYMIYLWNRQLDIPETITFGEPYDAVFKNFVDVDSEDFITDATKDSLYLLLNNPTIVRGFLLCMISSLDQYKIELSIKVLNRYWNKLPRNIENPLGYPEKLLHDLNRLSNIDLMYLMLVLCDELQIPNYDIQKMFH
jgi:hypothetical protein